MTLPAQPHLPVPVLGHPTFTVTLDSLRITHTRALHEDTDFVAFTVLLKSATDAGTPQTVFQSLGNLNDGTHFIGLAIEDLHIDPSQTLIFNYLVVNYGTQPKEQGLITELLKLASATLSTFGLVGGGTNLARPPLAGIGSILNSAQDWLNRQIEGAFVFSMGCDGLVAAEQVTLLYKDLLAGTASGPFQHETPHPGIDSPWGCGPNSMYYVDWRISRKNSIPTLPTRPTPVVLKEPTQSQSDS